MAAATTIETTEAPKTLNKSWDKVQATITSLKGQVTSQVDSFRKTIESARSQGTQRVATLRQDIDKLVANGKKLAETATKDIQKIVDIEQLKALVTKLQSTLDGLLKKTAKPASETPVAEVVVQVTEATTKAVE